MNQKRKGIGIFLLFLFCFFSYGICARAGETIENGNEEYFVETNGEYVFFATESEAEEVAEALGGWLTDYSHGIATIVIPQKSELYNNNDRETQNFVLEYSGVKIYPDIAITIEQEEGIDSEQEYLMDLGVQEAWKVARGQGQGVMVAVVDSGIDASHEELAHAVIYEGSVIPEESYGELLEEDYKGNFDHLGHGTHVAGIIAASDNSIGTVGIAPDSSIISIKALEKRNGKGYGKTSWIAKGIVEAVEKNADVINLSVGGTMVGDSVLHEAIQYAYDANVPVICAAGNNSSQRMFYPAAYAEAIAVSAVHKEGEQYVFDNSYSNYGSWIDFCAPGTNIYSTYPGGYRSMTGTSMACPIVTGAVALMLSKNPDFTINQVITCLKDTAIDLGDSGDDDLYGWGMVNIYALMDEFVEKPVPAIPTADIASGHYLMEGTRIQLFSESLDTVIFYTMDGTEPSLESMVYSGNILIEDSSQEMVTIKAIAVSKQGIVSETGVFLYGILPKQMELAHMSGEVTDEILPLYGATKDEVSGKECRMYRFLVPKGKKISLCCHECGKNL